MNWDFVDLWQNSSRTREWDAMPRWADLVTMFPDICCHSLLLSLQLFHARLRLEDQLKFLCDLSQVGTCGGMTLLNVEAKVSGKKQFEQLKLRSSFLDDQSFDWIFFYDQRPTPWLDLTWIKKQLRRNSTCTEVLLIFCMWHTLQSLSNHPQLESSSHGSTDRSFIQRYISWSDPQEGIQPLRNSMIDSQLHISRSIKPKIQFIYCSSNKDRRWN